MGELGISRSCKDIRVYKERWSQAEVQYEKEITQIALAGEVRKKVVQIASND